MRALVTGGAGFIGSTLVDRLLEDGNSVDVVDNLSTGSRENLTKALTFVDTFHYERIDIRDSELARFISRRCPDIIFHLAAQPSVGVSVDNPFLDAEINVLGSLRVLDAARTVGVQKVVFAASGGTLYRSTRAGDLPFTEEQIQGPDSPYGISKRTVLDYLHAYKFLYGLEFTALALANVYGPRQDSRGEAGVVAMFAANIATGNESTIFGDGDQTRDFVYVDDVVSAFLNAATMGNGLVINIGTGKRTSINELYRTMARTIAGAPPVRHVVARSGEVRHSAVSPMLASEALSWRPTISLPIGIATTLEAAMVRKSKKQISQ